MKTLVASLFALACALPLAAAADDSSPTDVATQEWQRAFYPAELIMKHQDEIGLSAEQRRKITTEMKAAQVEFVDLQFALYEQSRAALALVRQPRIDEKAAAAAARKVMELENRIKLRYLALNIRIKNALTREQQRRLDALRAR